MKRFVLVLGVCLLGLWQRGSAQEAATKEDIEQIKGALDGMSESAAEYRGYVDALRKIKVSGYIQSQWRYTDVVNQSFAIGNFSGGQFPGNVKNLFQVRRGRLKVTYDNTLTQYVLQIDAIQTGLSLKDAYIQITEPWMKQFGVQAGVFDRPFGYEISYSSGSRETPERSRMFQTLFPGERELGAKLFWAPQSGNLSFLRADCGVFNGSGPNANEYDSDKDFIGRIGALFPFDQIGAELDLGVSGYFGKVRSGFKEIYNNGEPAVGVKGFVKSTDSLGNVGAALTRRYLGVDFQFYYDVPMVGGAIIRGEFIGGKQPGSSSSTTSPTAQPTTALYQRDFFGWYLYYVQNIGLQNQLIVKYDVYDPNTNVEASDFRTNSNLTVADIKYSTLGLGWVHHWDENIKFVLYWEMINNEKLASANIPVTNTLFPYTDDVRDNVLTLRVQYRF